MWYSPRVLSMVGVCGLLTLAGSAQTAAKPAESQNSITIVFKDGRQRSFLLADIARIDFNSPATAASASASGRNRFLGKWRVGDGAGSHFYITLTADGEAKKTLGAAHGTWTMVNGEARISWDDGWHDVIRKAGDGYEKAAFEPGKSFTDDPSNVTDAKNAEPKPI
jgi:hypothetical protein